MSPEQDIFYMKKALELARKAGSIDEVPVGALIVKEGEILAEAYNLREQKQAATGHAELIAIEKACQKLGAWRLLDCTLYVTLEPCLMCAGALYQSRISRVVYACKDPKGGALGSLYSLHEDTRLNHNFPVTEGILAEESSSLLKSYFRLKRK